MPLRDIQKPQLCRYQKPQKVGSGFFLKLLFQNAAQEHATSLDVNWNCNKTKPKTLQPGDWVRNYQVLMF